MKSILFWFRRDLRLRNNAGLDYALETRKAVHCVFVFDRAIFDALLSYAGRRVGCIWESVHELDQARRQHGGELSAVYGRAVDEMPRFAHIDQLQREPLARRASMASNWVKA